MSFEVVRSMECSLVDVLCGSDYGAQEGSPLYLCVNVNPIAGKIKYTKNRKCDDGITCE